MASIVAGANPAPVFFLSPEQDLDPVAPVVASLDGLATRLPARDTGL